MNNLIVQLTIVKIRLFRVRRNNKTVLYFIKTATIIWYLYLYSAFQKQNMNRIKEVLHEKGIKQTWLADRLGKSFNMVNDYCNNRRQPTIEVLYQIAELLNVSPKELLID